MCRLHGVIPWKMRNSFPWNAFLAEGTPTWDGCQLQSGSCAVHSRDFIMSGWYLMCSASWNMGSTDYFPLHNRGARQPISSTSFIYCTKVFKTLPENGTAIQKCIAVCFPSPNTRFLLFPSISAKGQFYPRLRRAKDQPLGERWCK